jgi:lipid II:glycine glycyltransferase (peptidoglycan interpeptide bridge formation enzyme)
MGMERIRFMNSLLHTQYTELSQLNLEECIDAIKNQTLQTEQLRKKTEELEEMLKNEKNLSASKISELQSQLSQLEQHASQISSINLSSTNSDSTPKAATEVVTGDTPQLHDLSPRNLIEMIRRDKGIGIEVL